MGRGFGQSRSVRIRSDTSSGDNGRVYLQTGGRDPSGAGGRYLLPTVLAALTRSSIWNWPGRKELSFGFPIALRIEDKIRT